MVLTTPLLKTLAAWALLATGLLVTALATLEVKDDRERDALSRFAVACDELALSVRERLESYELILRGGAALFAASEYVSRQEWKAYVDSVGAAGLVPGYQAIGFARTIPASERAAHIAAVRDDGFTDYDIRPPGPRDFYSSIVYIEPFGGTNLRAFGYDMYSEPVRRSAMQRARDTGTATLSGRVRLVQEVGTDSQPGWLMYVPVYRHGMPLTTVEQRRGALVGWSYGPFRMNDFMSGLLRRWHDQHGEQFRLRIYFGFSPREQDKLFDNGKPDDSGTPDRFSQQRTIVFHGTSWLMELDRRPTAPGIDYSAAWLVLAGGTTVSFLLFALALMFLRTRERATRIADQLTTDIRQREQQLRESEFRWRFAIEGQRDGLWDWDMTSNKIFYSPRWKEMLGYSENEIGDSLDEWSSRVCPEELAAVDTAVQEHVLGRTPAYACEHRVRHKDGHYVWVLDRGVVVSRNHSGLPTRMIGTHTDISESRRQAEALRQRQAELEEAQRIGRIGSFTVDQRTMEQKWSEELYRIVGADPASVPPDHIQRGDFLTPESLALRNATFSRMLQDGQPADIELEVIRPDHSRGWLSLRAEVVRDAQGAITGLRGICADITERKEANLRVKQLNRFHAALSACNAAIARCETQEQLFTSICQIVVRIGGMDLAWIGLIDPHSGRIPPLASFGYGKDYLDGIEVSVNADDPNGRGPAGTAAREGRPVWVDDYRADSSLSPWHERGRRFGWQAIAALPIRRKARTIGVLTFYSRTRGFFSEEVRELLGEMASNIDFAMDKLEAEAEVRANQASLIESEQRFRNLVEQSIAGTLIIQEGTIAYANPRVAQILGHDSGEDLVGKPVLDLVSPKDRDEAGLVLRRVGSGESTKVDFLFSALRKDGALVDVAINGAMATYQSRPAFIALMQDISDRKVAEDQIRRYARQLEHTFMQAVGLATTLSEMRDAYTAGHAHRVAQVAAAIGREMGLPENTIEGLRVGGQLHDVGKITVPAEILAKPGRLTQAEYALIREHPRAGFDILKGVDFPWPVAQIALQHQERIDGSGYPQGLKGEEILLEARIMAVADVVESMASHRPYRPALGIEKALAEIEAGAGTLYDSAAAAACLRLIREKGFVIPS